MELAHKLFSTRGGTLVLAGIAATLAAVAVLVYVNGYRDSVKGGGQPATVLVATALIPEGTPGSFVATKRLFQQQTMREDQLRDGALADPVTLSGRVAATDIYPGQQLTASDFTKAASTLAGRLIGAQRAMTIPVDAAHGMIGTIESGDRVDVYAGFTVEPVDSLGRPIGAGAARPVLRVIIQNVPVLDVEAKRSGVASSSDEARVTLRLTSKQAGDLAFASDNGKVWLVLRPPTGARPAPPSIITAETLLLGVAPVKAARSFGGS